MTEFDLDQSLGYLVAKTNLLMKIYFSRAIKQEKLSVTPEQWAVLYAAVKSPGISQTEIAKISMKDKANVTHIIDALEERGYIKRISDPEDRRIKVIEPTSEGEEVLQKLIGVAQASNSFFGEGLAEPELQSLIESLMRISASLEAALSENQNL